MISGISGIGAPGVITNITAASLGGITPVSRVVCDDGDAAHQSAADYNSFNNIDSVLLGAEYGEGDAPGEAYGLSANMLRDRSMTRNISVSTAAGNKASASANGEETPADATEDKDKEDESADSADGALAAGESAADTAFDGQPLSNAEKEQVAKLEARDAEVRAHEQAHLAAAGGYARGGAHYEYQQGPDGESYAVGGSVQIDTSEEATPEATIAKMQQVRSAAMAPAEPSAQDRAVAAAASQQMQKAKQEIIAETADDGGTQDTAANVSTAESEPTDNLAEDAGGDTSAAEGMGALGGTVSSEQGLPEIKVENAADSVHPNTAADSVSSMVSKLSYQQQRARLAYRAVG